MTRANIVRSVLLAAGDDPEAIDAIASDLRGSAAALRDARSGDRDGVLVVGPLTIDTHRHEASIDGEQVRLARREFALLTVLARHPGRVFTREQLLGLAWPEDVALEIVDRCVDVQVTRARRKLGDTGKRLLRTVHGVGYKLDDAS